MIVSLKMWCNHPQKVEAFNLIHLPSQSHFNKKLSKSRMKNLVLSSLLLSAAFCISSSLALDCGSRLMVFSTDTSSCIRDSCCELITCGECVYPSGYVTNSSFCAAAGTQDASAYCASQCTKSNSQSLTKSSDLSTCAIKKSSTGSAGIAPQGVDQGERMRGDFAILGLVGFLAACFTVRALLVAISRKKPESASDGYTSAPADRC